MTNNAVNYYYWNWIRNVGDNIMAYILNDIFDRPPFMLGQDYPHLLGAGSIVGKANNKSYVWGSGVLSPSWGAPNINKKGIYALRGYKTLNFLRYCDLPQGDVVLGDPGFLVDKVAAKRGLYEERLQVRASVVPHHSSYQKNWLKKYENSNELNVIDVVSNDLSVIKEIIDSSVVISESLHGLIFAEALGKPSVWISERTDADWCFKFEDWYSTCRCPQNEPLNPNLEIDTLLRSARKAECFVDRKSLIESCPLDYVSVRAPDNFVDFEECRKKTYRKLFLQTPLPYLANSKLSDLSDYKISNISGILERKIRDFYIVSSEPSFTVICAEGNDISEKNINTGIRFLEQMPEYDFVLVKENGVRGTKESIFVDRYNGDEIYYYEDQPSYLLGTPIIRPMGWFSFSSRFSSLRVI